MRPLSRSRRNRLISCCSRPTVPVPAGSSPEFQHLAVGDHIPDGPPEVGCEFTVAQLESGRHLVLHSEEHLPPWWRVRFGAWIDWTWAFVLDDLGGGRTRFIFRSRGRAGPWWVAAAYLLAIIPADFVMSRQMLHGVKARAEGATAAGLHDAEAPPGTTIGLPDPLGAHDSLIATL
jgi:hypothetical protein